jgi:ABC-2 type transport system permease protein/oleandomycin transport system permease protein
MTAVATELAVPTAQEARPRPVGDALTLAWRNVLNIRRNPQLLVFATIQPVVFVLMFRYVFGGAINTAALNGVPYIDYLMPGIFVQTVVFGALTTAVGLATDLNLGLIERFRSLPIARSAVLVGRTLADLGRNLFVIVLMCVVGFVIGWRIHTSVFGLLGAVLLILAFAYSLSWVFAFVGLSVRDPETAQAASFPILAPLIFASSAFVPVQTMPGWLQPWAEHQPVSVVVNAARALTAGPGTLSSGQSTTELVVTAIAWIVAIVAVFAPLAVRRYRRVA